MVEPLARPKAPRMRALVYVWAIAGVLLLLVQGLLKLVPMAAQAVRGPLSPLQSAILWGFVAVNLYLEGYRGFQLRFVPRVIARALYLARARDMSAWVVVAAPLFAMGFFHAERRARRAAWILSSLIVLAVILIRYLPHPWRGVIDAGVVAGLGYGTLNLVQQALVAAFTGTPRASAELPPREPADRELAEREQAEREQAEREQAEREPAARGTNERDAAEPETAVHPSR